ncbi:MAG: (2Fe-2S) ferredoxin domain-containing protein [Ignavibacterium sp.]|nr:(2Fe-2S) ferredoxin domain-containing protein [Ignavibacterium sp.]
MKRFEKHVFICNNSRPAGHPRGCCFDKGSKELIDEFKKKVAAAGLNKKIRVNLSGCLDACEQGIAMVVYPEQVWYGKIKLEDIDEIIHSHLINDKPVERLELNEQDFKNEK